MPDHPPLACSGPREPTKRPRPIPRPVKNAIVMMVRGLPDDPDTKPLGLIDAARAAGVRPPILRRYLTRPSVIAFLRSQRRAFRDELCAQNEAFLADIRAHAQNSMAQLGAIRTLEELDAEDHSIHRRSEPTSPWITINITPSSVAPPATPMKTIEHSPAVLEPVERCGLDGYRCDEFGRPVFDPDRPRY